MLRRGMAASRSPASEVRTPRTRERNHCPGAEQQPRRGKIRLDGYRAGSLQLDGAAQHHPAQRMARVGAGQRYRSRRSAAGKQPSGILTHWCSAGMLDLWRASQSAGRPAAINR
jgi:hypothetical protein